MYEVFLVEKYLQKNKQYKQTCIFAVSDSPRLKFD